MPIWYELKTSFTNISGSNGLISIKFIQPFQGVIWESKYTFSSNFNYFTKPFNIGFQLVQWPSRALEVSRKVERIKIFLYLGKTMRKQLVSSL